MDRSEPPATIGVLISAAADEASLALALDWGRTLLTHLHSAPWHEGEWPELRSQPGKLAGCGANASGAASEHAGADLCDWGLAAEL